MRLRLETKSCAARSSHRDPPNNWDRGIGLFANLQAATLGDVRRILSDLLVTRLNNATLRHCR